ncbi:MAG: hypothetical protein KDH96_09335, partial [Candidatus Riesia sp.]|nr:hypothetical protein [Candidatus Riesia sp.]
MKETLDLTCEEQYDVNEFVNIAFQSKDEYILDWICGRTKEEILSYVKTSDTIRGFDILQILCGDLAIKTNIAIHQEYFDATQHYGAYLKGAVATRSYINKGVVLIEINAVKDISKHALKKALKENGGVVRAHHGHEYIIGMMQDYSRGGIRVQSQPNTYIRSHYYDDSFVMADHIDRFADFLYELMEQISKGIAVEEIIKNLKTGMRFTNAGESDLELSEFLADLEETARGFLPAMWNHQMGRSIIKNTFKVLCARYSFGFMTSAMKRIGTFVSVKSYITDLNILPAAYQNKAYHKDSVFVKFDNGQKFKQRLPLTVVLYVNEQFWNKMGVTSCLAGILRYPVSNEDMFSGCLVVSPDSIIEDEEIRRLAGFSGYSEELLEWFFAGMSNGIYANSITIKELLCGDSDGDTAGLVPMDVKFSIKGSNVVINMDSPDAKFLWAIHEVRDLKKRKFLELEGFTHMQGNRKISPAAVEHVLAESNKAIGPCALFQQSTKGILDTYDKDLFIVRERPSWQKPREGEVRIKEGKEMATFKWFIERYIIPVYRILPCSLELAIMSQKKDLMKAFQYVTSLLLDESGEVKYGERGERSCEMFDVALVAELEKQADADYVFHVNSSIREIVDLTDWAKEMGLITRNVLRACSIGTAAGFINWASATRTTAMAKKENPETLLADQTDEGWGIRQPDNLAWTNNEWVQYIKPVFVRVREAMDRMIHNDCTFGEDMNIRLSWNRVYDRGSFNRLNLNSMTD